MQENLKGVGKEEKHMPFVPVYLQKTPPDQCWFIVKKVFYILKGVLYFK